MRVFIGGACGATHLPGVMAAKTTLPILLVPMPSKHLQGMDSPLSIVQMPKSIPVACFTIGEAGAVNAALMAVAILADTSAELNKKFVAFRTTQTERMLNVKLSPL